MWLKPCTENKNVTVRNLVSTGYIKCKFLIVNSETKNAVVINNCVGNYSVGCVSEHVCK